VGVLATPIEPRGWPKYSIDVLLIFFFGIFMKYASVEELLCEKDLKPPR
jgi:hypothetical protein